MSQSARPADTFCIVVCASAHPPKSPARAALTGPAKATDMRQNTITTKYRIYALLPYHLTKVSHCLRLLEKQTPELGKRGAASSDIEVTNPGHLICHLDEGAIPGAHGGAHRPHI
jgi:hypothetical protein